jgi:hypothetical protein
LPAQAASVSVQDLDRFKTPPIPDAFRAIRRAGYRNIHEFDLGTKNLWGTETLLGDWDGEHLLIAKDFYPADYIRRGIAAGADNPYRHKPVIPTNRNLLKVLNHFGRLRPGYTNTECGFLYISACFLLRDDGHVRGALPDEDVVLRLSAPVVTFTLERMPNVKRVVAMGESAARAVKASGLAQTIKHRRLAYHEVRHPSYAMSDAARFAQWEPVFRGC